MAAPAAFALCSSAEQTVDALIEIGTGLAHRRPLPEGACALAFVSAHHADDATALSAGLGDALGDIPILGLGCAGAFCGLALDEDGPGMAVVILFDTAAQVRAARHQTLGSHTAGALLADGPYASLRILSSSPEALDPDNLLTSLDEAGAPVLGGLSVFAPGADGATVGSVSAPWPATAMLGLGEHRAVVAVGQSTAPVGPLRTCTRVDGPRVLEIDGRPALEMLYQDVPRPGPGGAPTPVFANVAADDDGLWVTQHVVGVEPATGSIVMPGRVPAQASLMFSEMSAEMARQDLEESLHALKESIAGQRPEAVLVFSCTARREGLLGTPLYDVGRALDLLGDDDVPVVGGRFAGEIVTYGARTQLLNYTAVVAALLKV